MITTTTHHPRPTVQIGGQTFGGGKLFLFAGPCVLESPELIHRVAGELAEIAAARGVPLVFKSSFDKANRSSMKGARGPGIGKGLELLAAVKERWKLPLVTDVHSPEQCARAAEVVDVLQIPAFLCRQTDLLIAAAETGRAVNIKKGQFLAPWDMTNATKKCEAAGNSNLLVTERGASFGYGRLVVDMTGFAHLAKTGHPVVFDATHSVQEPGALGTSTGGDRTKVPSLARAAVATGDVDGLFFEVHPDPDRAPSDGPNMLELARFGEILDSVLAVHRAVRATATG
ncbi:MAG TPA: 3-deoxy-8-phosphooctulonate synthase [Planctomycetota bacterium]|nr:3-deoxy-8-phosphooctulonate synthase [Planctomycetota bacterium]